MIFVAPYRFADTGNLALHFHSAHLADLLASGLSDDTITAAGVCSLRPCDIASYFYRGNVPDEVQSALCFPYQDSTFARIKLFPPGPYASRPKLGKMKYAQPPETRARLYIPFPIEGGAVYVCEGEKKTLAAHQARLNAVGVCGVWAWMSKGEPIDDLNLISWDGRDVTVIPDGDVFHRPDLLRAIYALGRELRDQGASVYVAQIPQPGAAKVGLDDFLVAGGNVSGLEVFALSHSIFKSAAWWHGKWKFTRALRAA